MNEWMNTNTIFYLSAVYFFFLISCDWSPTSMLIILISLNPRAAVYVCIISNVVQLTFYVRNTAFWFNYRSAFFFLLFFFWFWFGRLGDYAKCRCIIFASELNSEEIWIRTEIRDSDLHSLFCSCCCNNSKIIAKYL